MSELKITVCPLCPEGSIDFYTGRCDKCDYTTNYTPYDIAQQYTKDIIIPCQLQKLKIEEDDILIITPETPFSQNEAKNITKMFQSSTRTPFYIVFMNENIKIENLNDEKLKSIGLKRIIEN